MKGKENKRNINKKQPQKKHQHEVLAKRNKSKSHPLNKSKSKSQIKKSKQTDSKQETSKVKVPKGNGGKFTKGAWTGNNKGRPKGSKNKFSIAELQQAMKNCEKRERMSFMEAWIECAWGNPGDMATIANFMLPKLKSIEQIIVPGESTEGRKRNLEIQRVLQDRCKTEADKRATGNVTI